MLRFVDGGRLSLRPASRLQMRVTATPQQPQLGAIKFRLDEGVVRSITGSWGRPHVSVSGSTPRCRHRCQGD